MNSLLPPQPTTGGADAVHWHPGLSCCDSTWEEAYARFETPEQEISKFAGRLRRLGVAQWDKSLRVVELFCGRGNGLRALQRLGFEHLSGVDLSPTLLAQYDGPARRFVGDCRELKFGDNSQDAMIVQGGLHHLPVLPADLEQVLAEIRRVVRPGGHVVVVEPWGTPFLSLVHALCQTPLRRRWGKLDALATMIEQERETYERWLGMPEAILRLLQLNFQTRLLRIQRGKLSYVGQIVD